MLLVNILGVSHHILDKYHTVNIVHSLEIKECTYRGGCSKDIMTLIKQYMQQYKKNSKTVYAMFPPGCFFNSKMYTITQKTNSLTIRLSPTIVSDSANVINYYLYMLSMVT